MNVSYRITYATANLVSITDACELHILRYNCRLISITDACELHTVNQQILAAIKFGVSQNIVIYVNLAAIKFASLRGPSM